MSTTTPTLGLILYDSSTDLSVSFATFRAAWGGPSTSSNFYKIDTWAGTVNTNITNLQNQRGAISVSAAYISANYYEATAAAIASYITGMTIILDVDTTSDGTVTLKINTLDTKSLMKVNSSGVATNLTGSDLVKGRKYLFVYDGTRWLWVSANSADQIQIVGTPGNLVTVGSSNNLLGTTAPVSLLTRYPSGHLYKLTLSNNGSDATNDIDISTGDCIDSTNTTNMVLASALTKRLDAAWTVGTNQGGLDTGSIANTTYFVWLIMRSDTGVVDALFSTSPTTPTMPASYDYKRRIGSIIRKSNAILGFVQDADMFRLKAVVVDFAGTNPGTSAVTRTVTVPVGIRVEGIFSASLLTADPATHPIAVAYLSDLSVNDEAPSVGGAMGIEAYGGGVSQSGAGNMRVMTNTSAQIRSRLTLSAVDTTFTLCTYGWIDTRDRL